MTISVSGQVSRNGWSLRVPSLEIGRGITAVVGANGVGKTTLGRLVAGLNRLDSHRGFDYRELDTNREPAESLDDAMTKDPMLINDAVRIKDAVIKDAVIKDAVRIKDAVINGGVINDAVMNDARSINDPMMINDAGINDVVRIKDAVMNDAGINGEVRINDRVVDQPSSGLFVAAHERNVGVVFQDHRLFGYLSAVDNVAFGLRRRGVSRREARQRAGEILDLVGVRSALWRKRPAALSGGQRQRVAVARALAPEPAVLIADEPLASVDRSGQARLRNVLANVPTHHVLLITHHPVDVWTLADAVVVIDNGVVVSDGTLEEVTASPGCEWAADFLGANVVAGLAQGTSVTTASGLVLIVATEAHGPVHVIFPAHSLTLHKEQPSSSARNTWLTRVTRLDSDGNRARASFDTPLAVRADITSRSVEELALRPGVEIWASVKATEMVVVNA